MLQLLLAVQTIKRKLNIIGKGTETNFYSAFFSAEIHLSELKKSLFKNNENKRGKDNKMKEREKLQFLECVEILRCDP